MSFQILRSSVLCCFCALLLAGTNTLWAQEPIRVVSSFSILGDLVDRVGGEWISHTVLVGADGDVHAYEPTATDARIVAEADLVVVNGLGFDAWMERLLDAAEYRGTVVHAAASGVDLLALGVSGTLRPDPHAWLSVPNAMAYVNNIRDALIVAMPQHANGFRAEADSYLQSLNELDEWIRHAIAGIPEERRRVMTTHRAFAYFGQEYGIDFVSALSVNTASEPSARDVALLIQQIRVGNVHAVFLENISSPRLATQIADEGGIRIGGVLYSDALSAQEGPAPTYVDLMRYNTRQLVTALAGP